MNNTVCFTGPLPKRLYGYNHDAYNPLVNAIENCAKSLYNNGYTHFISGGAQGVDQLAFWAVHRLKMHGYTVQNDVYIPFEGQDNRWNDVGLFSKQQYRLMLSWADNVYTISQHVDFSDYKAISQAMLARNRAMVDHSDVVFGVYFDNSWQNSGKAIDPGTVYTLQYGAKCKKHCMVLNVNTLRLV